MPPANTHAPEPTVAAPREFVADSHALAAARLEDCHDYANDGFGDETEQADWEQEQARIRRTAETAEALLQPAEPAIPEQFRQWLQTLTWFDGQPFVGPIPSDLVEPGVTGLRAKLNTGLFSTPLPPSGTLTKTAPATVTWAPSPPATAMGDGTWPTARPLPIPGAASSRTSWLWK